MKTFYSHSKKLEDGTIKETKLLSDHLNNIIKINNTKYLPSLLKLEFQNDCYKIYNDLAIFHDIGKYTEYFQKYL